MIVDSTQELTEAIGRAPHDAASIKYPLELSTNEIASLRANPALGVCDIQRGAAQQPPTAQFPFEDEHQILGAVPPRWTPPGPLAGYGDVDRNPPNPFPWGSSPTSGGGGMQPGLGRGPFPGGANAPRWDPPSGPFGGAGRF